MGKWELNRNRSYSHQSYHPELERAVQAEIKDVRGKEELFLRSTSELTSLMKHLGRTQGRAYFRYVLRDVFGEKSRIYEARGPPSNKQVCAYAKTVIQRLAKAIHFAPIVLRTGCQYMLNEFRKAFPECKQDARIVVGSLLFLRILCPALIKPEMFDFPVHTTQSLPMGVQIAKILQHTLSGTPMGNNDPAFHDNNAFIFAFEPYVANFLVCFPQIRGRSVAENSSNICVSNEIPLSPTTPNTWESSPPVMRRPNGKLRGLSMSANETLKKKRFTLRFWSRGPGGSGGSGRPTP